MLHQMMLKLRILPGLPTRRRKLTRRRRRAGKAPLFPGSLRLAVRPETGLSGRMRGNFSAFRHLSLEAVDAGLTS